MYFRILLIVGFSNQVNIFISVKSSSTTYRLKILGDVAFVTDAGQDELNQQLGHVLKSTKSEGLWKAPPKSLSLCFGVSKGHS